MNNKNPDLKLRTYVLSLDAIKLIDQLDVRDQVTKIIKNQLTRSMTSIGSNVWEAKGGKSNKDFAKFFSYALKSANETKYWLGILRDSNRVSSNKINPILEEVKEIACMLGASLRTVREKE